MSWDALCDMPVDVVKFLNYVDGERDEEQDFVQIELTTYADLMDKIKYENVDAACILFKNTSASGAVLLSPENFASVGQNATLYAYFEIQPKIMAAMVSRSVFYGSGHRHDNRSYVIHHSGYEDLLDKLEFNGLAPDATFILNQRHGLVELTRNNYGQIVWRDEIFTHFRMKGSRFPGSRFEELSSIDTRLAGIHINSELCPIAISKLYSNTVH